MPEQTRMTNLMSLDRVCELITDGKHGDCTNENSSGYYFISAKDVRNGKINYENARQITREDFLQTNKRTRLGPLDILIVSTGATIGRMALVQDNEFINRTTFQKSVAILKPNQAFVSPHWLFFKLNQVKEELINLSGGTAQGNLLLRDLRAFKIEVPPLSVQYKIASILSAYKDLIENGTCRIQILEEMAQSIYREWFVQFRFPGHENVRLVDSRTELGLMPEGWVECKLGEVADVSWGDTTVTKKTYVQDGFTAFSGSGPDGYLDYYDYDRDGIVLSAIGANCGITWFAQGKWSCIKNTIRYWAITDSVSNEYLYFATFGKDFWPKRGAAQPFISQTDAQNVKILLPTVDVQNNFTNIVSPILSLIALLKSQNDALYKTRDLLLPKLVSGKLDVSELDITIP